LHQIGRVEPGFPQLVQAGGGGGNGLCARVVCIVGGGDVGGQALGERLSGKGKVSQAICQG
jgi:hypothetical protein